MGAWWRQIANLGGTVPHTGANGLPIGNWRKAAAFAVGAQGKPGKNWVLKMVALTGGHRPFGHSYDRMLVTTTNTGLNANQGLVGSYGRLIRIQGGIV